MRLQEKQYAEEKLIHHTIVASGGKGYTFADKVVARLLMQMLARSFPLEPALGLTAGVHFETKESGRSLDDLHLVLKDGVAPSRWSILVKSNRQLSANGFDNTFVADAWADGRGRRAPSTRTLINSIGHRHRR